MTQCLSPPATAHPPAITNRRSIRDRQSILDSLRGIFASSTIARVTLLSKQIERHPEVSVSFYIVYNIAEVSIDQFASFNYSSSYLIVFLLGKIYAGSINSLATNLKLIKILIIDSSLISCKNYVNKILFLEESKFFAFINNIVNCYHRIIYS